MSRQNKKYLEVDTLVYHIGYIVFRKIPFIQSLKYRTNSGNFLGFKPLCGPNVEYFRLFVKVIQQAHQTLSCYLSKLKSGGVSSMLVVISSNLARFRSNLVQLKILCNFKLLSTKLFGVSLFKPHRGTTFWNMTHIFSLFKNKGIVLAVHSRIHSQIPLNQTNRIFPS